VVPETGTTTRSSQDAEYTVEAALVEARTTAEEMRLAARSYQRKSWIAVLLAAVLSTTVTLWLTDSLSLERVVSWLRQERGTRKESFSKVVSYSKIKGVDTFL
jgi:hypothetical protein